ncbi:MAG: hypothetical protein M1812_001772 [Candelaria pacifica]|nr:MAG: hypothetical protein M1812_001772 [Candelaria pacifica]
MPATGFVISEGGPGVFVPNDILVIILSYLGKEDLKTLRQVCKLWESFATRPLFDRVFISPQRINLDVFLNISQHKTISAYVKEIVYDTVYFDPKKTFHQYREDLDHELHFPGRGLFSRKLHVYESVVTAKVLAKGFSTYRTHCNDQLLLGASNNGLSASDMTSEAAQVLCQGLAALPNIRTATLANGWSKMEQEGTRAPRRKIGSPLARSWNPLHLEPELWLYSTYQEEEYHGFHTMINALAATTTNIRHFDIKLEKPSWGLSPFCFQDGPPSRMDSIISAFRNLHSLTLFISTMPDTRNALVKDLNALLPTISGLRHLSLSLDHNSMMRNNHPTTREVFGHHHWPMLTSLSLEGFGTTEIDILDFLDRHRTYLTRLSFKNFRLLKGSWVAVTQGIVSLKISVIKIHSPLAVYLDGRQVFLTLDEWKMIIKSVIERSEDPERDLKRFSWR